MKRLQPSSSKRQLSVNTCNLQGVHKSSEILDSVLGSFMFKDPDLSKFYFCNKTVSNFLNTLSFIYLDRIHLLAS